MNRKPFDQKPIEDYLKDMDLKRVIPLAGLAVLIIIALSGVSTAFYTVQPEEQAVVKRLGKVVDIKNPGLHFKLPFGIDRNYNVPVQRVLKQEFGFLETAVTDQRAQYRKVPDESLMLTGDLKVIDVEWVVQYLIDDPDKYLHRVHEGERTIRDISEAVMRRIVGNSLGSDVVTEKRVRVARQSKDEIQEILNSFDMGVMILTVELQDVMPPERVKPAFNEVNQAEQERERLINEAEKRRNQVIPRARGEARQMIETAEGYRAQRVNRALGEAQRFTAILEQYRKLPEVTRRRIFLETMDEVLPKLGRVYVMDKDQIGPIPLLNLGDGAAIQSVRGGSQ